MNSEITNELKNRICLECGKRLVTIGSNRSNGRGHHFNDWKGRKYHIKCFKNK